MELGGGKIVICKAGGMWDTELWRLGTDTDVS